MWQKCLSSIQCLYSSRCPLDNELSPITTWPRLPIFSNLNFMDKHPTAISVLWVKALKSSPKSKKSPNLVTLIGSGYRVQKYAKTHFQVNKRIKLLGMDLCTMNSTSNDQKLFCNFFILFSTYKLHRRTQSYIFVCADPLISTNLQLLGEH